MKIKWVEINSKSYLEFVFETHLQEQEALKAIEQWKKEFSTLSASKVSIIWDCLLMKGYDAQARIHWQQAIKELKPKIDTIWLISGSTMIRIGASLMSKFAGLNISAVDSYTKIK